MKIVSSLALSAAMIVAACTGGATSSAAPADTATLDASGSSFVKSRLAPAGGVLRRRNLLVKKRTSSARSDSERIIQDDIIFSYLSAKRLGLETDYRKDVYEKVNDLTFDDVKKFYADYIANQKYTYCVIGSRDKINMDDLKKIGEVKELSLTDIFGY